MISQPTSLAVALLITLAGVWLRWNAHAYRMRAEEAMKDRKLTQRQVDRRLRWVRRGGRYLTLGGMGLLIASVLWMES